MASLFELIVPVVQLTVQLTVNCHGAAQLCAA
jgi:hypothetical protein